MVATATCGAVILRQLSEEKMQPQAIPVLVDVTYGPCIADQPSLAGATTGGPV
jgi:hypothetical protein